MAKSMLPTTDGLVINSKDFKNEFNERNQQYRNEAEKREIEHCKDLLKEHYNYQDKICEKVAFSIVKNGDKLMCNCDEPDEVMDYINDIGENFQSMELNTCLELQGNTADYTGTVEKIYSLYPRPVQYNHIIKENLR